MAPQKIDLGECPLCKGSGFKRDSDFTKIDCICEETGNKYFIYELKAERNYFGPTRYTKGEYQDKSIFDKIKEHIPFGQVQYNGKLQFLYMNNLHRLEPFYTLNDYNLNHYHFPPLEDPLFPFPRKR